MQPKPFRQCVKCKIVHCCHSQSICLTACNTDISFATDNRSTVRTTTNIVKHLIQTSMKKNLSSQSMDAALQDFLGNKPNLETPKPEPQPADTQEQAGEVVPEQTDGTPQVVRRISGKQRRAASNAGHRWRSTRKLSSLFRPLKTASPCSSAAARATLLTVSSACSASGG